MSFNKIITSLLFAPLIFGAVDISIYSTKDLYKSAQKIESGVEFFKNSVKESCGITLDFNIKIEAMTSDIGQRFKSHTYYKKEVTKYGPQNFIYFQKDLYDYLDLNEGLVNSNGIKIHDVDEVEGHCAFAFPKIQFEKMNSKKLRKTLENHILLSRESEGCGSSSRLIAHELAHIFIQDDPPHRCGNKLCDEDNLLSVMRKMPTQTHFHSGSQRGFNTSGFGGHIGQNHDGSSIQKTPSIGRSLNSNQCQAIKKTYSLLKEN